VSIYPAGAKLTRGELAALPLERRRALAVACLSSWHIASQNALELLRLCVYRSEHGVSVAFIESDLLTTETRAAQAMNTLQRFELVRLGPHPIRGYPTLWATEEGQAVFEAVETIKAIRNS